MCLIHLDYRDARSIYTQIADQFRKQIRAGVLAPGEKLPSVRELAAELAINPNTIQRAYRELEAEGYIASVSGKGSFVCDMDLIIQPDMERLWKNLDSAVEALSENGVSIETVIQHLKQGGNTHA
jgi:GntR family transcriptional regulator